MDKAVENGLNIINKIIPFSWILIVACIAVCAIGVMSSKKDKRKESLESLAWIQIGAILLVGCVYVGKWIFQAIVF